MTPEQVQENVLMVMQRFVENRTREYGSQYTVSLDSAAIFARLNYVISRGRIVYALRKLVQKGEITRLGKEKPRYTLAKKLVPAG